jgi:hypothetical protein
VDPPEYLSILLHDARVFGHTFEGAWAPAVVTAAGISSTPGDWLEVLGATRDAWEGAYEGWPATAPEQALKAVGDGLSPDRSLDARCCKWCGLSVPTDRDPRAEFCDDACKRQWKYERERDQAGLTPRAHVDPHAATGWDASRAARPCEYCTNNWVPLDRERFCCDWCENRGRAAEPLSARSAQ